MKYLTTFLLTASIAFAYITPSDQVILDGRILLTNSRPMATFPWRGEHPRLSEYPNEGASDARELAALWEIKAGRLYLLAASAFRFDGFAPGRSVGLRELMPDRIKDGKVFADWFTGDFDVIEQERIDPKLFLRPEDAPPIRSVVRTFHFASGQATEMPNPSPKTAMLVTPRSAPQVAPGAAVAHLQR